MIHGLRQAWSSSTGSSSSGEGVLFDGDTNLRFMLTSKRYKLQERRSQPILGLGYPAFASVNRAGRQQVVH